MYHKFNQSFTYTIAGRSLCRTSRGHVGLVHEAMQIGDHVYAFLGHQVLDVLRSRSGSRREFEYIGELYLHGLMDGEAMDWLKQGSATVETVYLV